MKASRGNAPDWLFRNCENGIIINTPDVAFERCMLLSVLLK